MIMSNSQLRLCFNLREMMMMPSKCTLPPRPTILKDAV